MTSEQQSEETRQAERDGNAAVHKVGGDLVGRDKITTGDIHSSYVAVGESSQINVTIVEGAGKSDKPKQDEEPELILIPAGPFFMGNDEGDPAEAPRHVVDLPAFQISIYPITNEEYAQFVWQMGRVAGPALLWDGNAPPQDKRHCPVSGVTWYE